MNFQMLKLDLEKAGDQRPNCQHLLGHWKSKRVPEKHLFLLDWLAKVFNYVDHNKLLKILKEKGIPDHLTCLLRNLYAGQEATVRTGYGTIDWFQRGKGVRQGCILSPCLFNLYTEYIMRNARLDEAQLESRLWRKISISQICRWHHPYDRKWRGTKEPLDEGERGEWKSWLKTQHSRN